MTALLEPTLSGGRKIAPLRARVDKFDPPRAEFKVSLPVSSPWVCHDTKSNAKFVSFVLVVEVAKARWVVHRRYSDFRTLAEAMSKTEGLATLPRLPGRHLFGNFDDLTIERRRALLERYVRALLSDHKLCTEAALLEFLGARPRKYRSLDLFPYASRSGHFREEETCGTSCSVM
ncbi:hypothetical protein CTAYLR_007445 [Chrysophaeum taylorii]|uniref:PX domain-containing protein n=1 Tax=Chrysophaeum taylorii TaxID=2483200 RepID=A0AAD7XJP9_9STRA|nr:hypothetical protein CTAYLR_007445 [Chrysophaeum taylorii]